MIDDQYSRVIRPRGWHAKDSLNGTPLSDGDLLTVRFQDGHEETVHISVERKIIPVSEMGTTYNDTLDVATAPINVHGVLMPIELASANVTAKRN